ncbi:SH3 domain-containing protein [Falsochrobactrum sp. TDYN1]|uniref:SH3 domain-containing protein n=1 Tax=Falsochrobactrum tianjinense TaxID=2706015 RepID=A0A949UU57_9HYPH|nr:SH3 domain-containing protein [Falsochrobactrum sp. TDYN1]MBV2142753.1 SH3 domain-containing protein [Falsochrobactrum sp. TDYN1]
MKLSFKAAIVAVGVFSAGAAQAANAIVTADLNIRTGPGTSYGRIGSIPNRAPVTVHSCATGYSWCQVSYSGMSGWASSRYLAIREGSVRSDDFGRSAALIGIPLIAGVAIGAALNDRDDHWHRRDWHRSRWHHRHRHWDRPRHRGPRYYNRTRGGDGPHGQ